MVQKIATHLKSTNIVSIETTVVVETTGSKNVRQHGSGSFEIVRSTSPESTTPLTQLQAHPHPHRDNPRPE
ncbi:MAG TPA: hypothetical protein DIW81_23365 [Planctomycetaceae bacterium]|nr:hypothetical protein [Planctomycetaceae bacterium]